MFLLVDSVTVKGYRAIWFFKNADSTMESPEGDSHKLNRESLLKLPFKGAQTVKD